MDTKREFFFTQNPIKEGEELARNSRSKRVEFLISVIVNILFFNFYFYHHSLKTVFNYKFTF